MNKQEYEKLLHICLISRAAESCLAEALHELKQANEELRKILTNTEVTK